MLTRKAGEHEDGRDLLVATVHVPMASSMKELELTLSATEMRVEVEGAQPLEIMLQPGVEDGAAKAKYDKKARVLTVRMPVVAADGGEGQLV